MPTATIMRDGVLIRIETASPDPARVQAAADHRRSRVSIDGVSFLGRFTDAEYAGIIAAANAQLAQGDAQLYRWIETLRATNSVRVFGEEAQAAKAALVQAELLSQERADIIFV